MCVCAREGKTVGVFVRLIDHAVLPSSRCKSSPDIQPATADDRLLAVNPLLKIISREEILHVRAPLSFFSKPFSLMLNVCVRIAVCCCLFCFFSLNSSLY